MDGTVYLEVASTGALALYDTATQAVIFSFVGPTPGAPAPFRLIMQSVRN